MSVNRELFEQKIHSGGVPPWPCAECGVGTMRMIKKSFSEFEGTSRRHHKEEYFEYFMMDLRFVCVAECTNDRCMSISCVTGTGSVYECYHERGGPCYETVYDPKSVDPAPNLIVLSDDLPKNVRVEMRRAFQLFWVDLNASANAVRCSIEEAMNSCGVRRYQMVKKKGGGGKYRKPLSLHARIKELPEKHEEARNLLLASKWITNAGSHASNLEISDLFDAMDLAERSMSMLFDRSELKLRKLAAKVIKKKKPLGKKR